MPELNNFRALAWSKPHAKRILGTRIAYMGGGSKARPRGTAFIAIYKV